MKVISNRRVVATIVAASCFAVPASASAASLPSTYKSDAAQSGWAGSLRSSDRSDAAQSGIPAAAKVAYPPRGFTGGDNPADRVAPAAGPMTIEVVRPERTIVRNVDDALPTVLSGSALLLVLAGLGFMLTRNGTVLLPGRSD